MSEMGRDICGIYVIRNVTTGGGYFGSARCLATRWRQHRCDLRSLRHANERLQRAWSKYGEGAFSFQVLAVLERSEQYETESRLLRQHVGGEGCYNLALDARNAMLGRKHSAATRAAMSASRKGNPGTMTGRKHTAAALAKMSAVQKGRSISPEHRAKLSLATIGRKRAPELVARSAAANRGRKRSRQTCDRIAAAKRGVSYSAEARAKQAAGRVGLKRSPESVAKSAAAHRGKPRTEDVKARIAATLKGRSHSEETRAKMSAAKYAYWAAKRAALN